MSKTKTAHALLWSVVATVTCSELQAAPPVTPAVIQNKTAPSNQADAKGFLDGSSASLELRNFYLNRDFREDQGQSKREEWAQGFILQLESGYTPGIVGFGVDVIGMLGVKLDSGRGRSGTNLLPVDSDGRAEDNYSKAGAALKIRASKSEFRLGTMIPRWPTLIADNGRLLPQTFDGAQLTVNEFDKFEIVGAQYQSTVYRDQSNSSGLELTNRNRRFSGPLDGGDFNLAGLNYRAGEATNIQLQYAVFEDIYRQSYIGLTDRRKGSWGAFSTDLRFFNSNDTGSSRGGNIDNRAFSIMGTYKVGGHSFGAGYQKMSGDSAFPYVGGSVAYLITFAQVGDFADKNERSWQARYDFDLATVGIPGLTFMTRYIKGDDADTTSMESAKETELDIELQYVVQSGPVKDLNMRLRAAKYKSDFTRDSDELRVILSYPLNIF